MGVVLHRWPFSNYYHWLLDALRGAILLDDSGHLAALRQLILCMPDPAPRFVRQTLDAVGLPIGRVEVCTAPFDRVFERLLILTPHHVARGLPVAEYSRRLRQRLGSRREPGQARRILISRSDADQRRVTNERDLAAALADHAFEVVRPADLSFAEQVTLFASAELIVAPHGAALANLLFCEIGTSVIEFRSARLDRPWFEQLSAALGLRYTAVPTATDAAEPRDFRVDVALTTKLVEAALQLSWRRNRGLAEHDLHRRTMSCFDPVPGEAQPPRPGTTRYAS